MEKINTKYNSLKDLVEYLGKGNLAATNLLELLRWPDNRKCTSCGLVSDKHYIMSGNNDTYRCRKCGFKFKATTDTLLQGSKLRLPAFFVGIYLLYHFRDKISEKEMKAKMRIAPTCVLCGEWRERILNVLPMPYKQAEPKAGGPDMTFNDKYEAGPINLQFVFDALLVLKPNRKAGGRASIDRSTIEPLNID